MPEAFIVDALRSPIGRRKGGLAAVHAADLGAPVIEAIVARTGIDPAAIDDVIYGCIDTIGPQAGDIARTCALAAGLPESVPGVTIDRACGSSQQAIHFAAQAVMSGTADVVIAGGVQTMSSIPIAAAMGAGAPFGFADPWSTSERWNARYGGQDISQFAGAQRMADDWGISRESMEELALLSHERAARAQDEGRFDREILPYSTVTADEGPRRDSTAERLAGLQPLQPDGSITAALASQISDGAAALMIVNEQALKTHGLTPRARIHHLSVLGGDPVIMLSAPIAATARALERSGMALDDIDLVEINEAFASVVLAWLQETHADIERVNPNGGAIALGHPIGASGARLMTTLLHELERTGGRYGLQTMCEGGGQANVTIIERL
ncbi:MAG: Acetyl-CoA C-acyltransferase [Actinomycetia bacterium]|nr:Acetyl-CoA C-acyltransferase [Actinomycetes bacterium]